MSYLKSFPPKFRKTARISRLWYVDQVHPDACRCEGCFVPGQLRMFL